MSQGKVARDRGEGEIALEALPGTPGDEKPRKWSIRVINSELGENGRAGIKRPGHKSAAFVLI